MVISLILAKFEVKEIIIDIESSANILFFETTKQMQISEIMVTKKKIPLIGFSGEKIWTSSEVTLLVDG